MFLGHVEELGGQVASAFTNAVNTTVVQVTIPSPVSTLGTERLSDSAVLHTSDIVACHGILHAKLSFAVVISSSGSIALGLVAMR